MATGRRAPATVIEIARYGPTITKNTTALAADSVVVLKTRLRVEPPGEPPFEVQKRFRYPENAPPVVGSRLNVIYDPADHDEVMLEESPEVEEARLNPVGAMLREQMGGRPYPPVFGSTAPAPTAGPTAADPADRLRRLAELREAGVLTDDEFQAQRTRILGEL